MPGNFWLVQYIINVTLVGTGFSFFFFFLHSCKYSWTFVWGPSWFSWNNLILSSFAFKIFSERGRTVFILDWCSYSWGKTCEYSTQCPMNHARFSSLVILGNILAWFFPWPQGFPHTHVLIHTQGIISRGNFCRFQSSSAQFSPSLALCPVNYSYHAFLRISAPSAQLRAAKVFLLTFPTWGQEAFWKTIDKALIRLTSFLSLTLTKHCPLLPNILKPLFPCCSFFQLF